MRVCVQDRQRVRVGCAGRAGAPLTRSSPTTTCPFPTHALPPPPLSQLHVFVKGPMSKTFANVYVDDTANVAHLQEAAVAKLSLGVSPDRVEMFREKDGEATGDALDSTAGVKDVLEERARVIVKVSSTAAATIPAAPGALGKESDRGAVREGKSGPPCARSSRSPASSS
jgi:hypothetical protein